MSSSLDLARAMKNTLDESGDLIKVQSQLEEELLEAMNQSASEEGVSEYSFASKKCKPAMPPEIILANNLVRQYLEYVGLHKTSSVLCIESGLPNKSVPENVLRETFPNVHRSGEKPLLLHMVNNILKSNY